MPLILNFIGAVVFFVGAVCKVFYWLLILRIILSWVGVNPSTHFNELLGTIFQATDFILQPFARLPLRIGMIDLSPMVAIAVLYFLPSLVAQVLYALVGAAR